jgi:hypothetical protein
MTNKELKEAAEWLSGRPARKNKLGIGAYRWLADKLDVHPSTMARWIRGRHGNTGSDIPQWVVDHIDKMKATKAAEDKAQQRADVERSMSVASTR